MYACFTGTELLNHQVYIGYPVTHIGTLFQYAFYGDKFNSVKPGEADLITNFNPTCMQRV